MKYEKFHSENIMLYSDGKKIVHIQYIYIQLVLFNIYVKLNESTHFVY